MRLTFGPDYEERVFVLSGGEEYMAEVVGLRRSEDDPLDWTWDLILVYDHKGSVMSDSDVRWPGLAAQAVRESVLARVP
tara:strand:- start:202 stop:438 length:237 start_codon:yes stop_codon:yes gene_type:complete